MSRQTSEEWRDEMFCDAFSLLKRLVDAAEGIRAEMDGSADAKRLKAAAKRREFLALVNGAEVTNHSEP